MPPSPSTESSWYLFRTQLPRRRAAPAVGCFSGARASIVGIVADLRPQDSVGLVAPFADEILDLAFDLGRKRHVGVVVRLDDAEVVDCLLPLGGLRATHV